VYISVVRSVLKISVGALLAGGLGLSSQAVAPDASSTQYHSIPDRNVFGLRPPPEAAGPTNPPVVLPKITLTGITTILGNKRALMKVAPKGMKPGDPKELSMILTEGQREGDIEVLQIDENRGTVKVNNSGTEMLLTFEKDGAKLPQTPAPRPGIPPAPTALPTAPQPAVGMHPGLPTAPARTRFPAFPRGETHTAGTTSTVPAPAVGGVPTPTGLQSLPNQPIEGQEQLTAEELAIVNELQRQANATLPTFTPPNSEPATQAPQATGTSAVPGTAVTPSNPTQPVILPQ